MSLLDEFTIERGSVGKHMEKSSRHIQMIHINDIRPNPLNAFHIYTEEVESLAQELEKRGVNNGRVYYDDLHDGKHYTLIGGETRYRALCYLYENGRHDGIFPMYVVEKPTTKEEELAMIMGDNNQRYLSEEDKRMIIQNYEQIYEYYKKLDKELDNQIEQAENQAKKDYLEEQRHLPKGISKRDWIASKTRFTNRNGTNISGRQVQKYLTGEFSGKKKDNSKETDKKKENAEEKEILNRLKNHLIHLTDASITVSSTKLTISYANIYDLNRVLQAIKSDNYLDYITNTFIKTKRS